MSGRTLSQKAAFGAAMAAFVGGLLIVYFLLLLLVRFIVHALGGSLYLEGLAVGIAVYLIPHLFFKLTDHARLSSGDDA